jgi:hypothetical protein
VPRAYDLFRAYERNGREKNKNKEMKNRKM